MDSGVAEVPSLSSTMEAMLKPASVSKKGWSTVIITGGNVMVAVDRVYILSTRNLVSSQDQGDRPRQYG